MTREEVNDICISKVDNSSFLLLELCTGFGKTRESILMVNHLVDTKYKGKHTSMLLLVAKTVHKQTWRDEFAKWGGIHVDSLTIECYESLKKHEGESFDIVVMDEVHHVGSDARLDSLKTLKFGNAIGLSATIPKKLKSYLQYEYHAEVISCNVTEAIESDVLPEPQIVLFPLQLDRTKPTEAIEINPKVKGKVYHAPYAKMWDYKKMKVHAIISCTQRQKVNEYDRQIEYEKKRYMVTRQEFMKNKWLFDCGERIKYLANLKTSMVNFILYKLKNERTITFCKTIEQAELVGKFAIHSKNKDSNTIYKMFNNKEINHITSVNILNENANLVDCKYAIFANYSSSESVALQRLGRSLRHRSPVIIMPYYEKTREEEIVKDMIGNFNKDCIHVIHNLRGLDKFI